MLFLSYSHYASADDYSSKNSAGVLSRRPGVYNCAMQHDPCRHLSTPYDLAGGEPIIRKLVDRFYGLTDEDLDFYGIRKLHPATLDGSREKLFKFLMGWLGGPPLYEHEYGHTRLRARHLPLTIASTERDQWVTCMTRAMVDVGPGWGIPVASGRRTG